MTNDYEENYPACPSCGSRLTGAHLRGCPQDPFKERNEWRFADGRVMPEANQKAITELSYELTKYVAERLMAK